MKPAIRLEDVTKRYKDVVAVSGVTLSVGNRQVLGIVGPSGAGKSTLLRLMDLLEKPDEGHVNLFGEVVCADSPKACEFRKRIGMVLQKPVVLNRSVWNNLAYPLRIRGAEEEAVAKGVDAELARLGLTDRAHKNARTLSGGEMQRLCFSRATIHDPDLLLLDEFAANLDPSNVALLEGSVRDYASRGHHTVVTVTHNLFQAKRMCDAVALIWDGRVIEKADRNKFFENPDDERTAQFVRGELVY